MSGRYIDPPAPGSGYPSQSHNMDPRAIEQSHSNRSSRTHPDYTSPTSNPHGGIHPLSFGRGISYTAAALGAPLSNSSSSASLGMSISPPHWPVATAPWPSSGSYVGSVGALGTSFGRERDRELEAKYVRDFSCCGRQLNGLHELLEHYEEEHANLAPDARMAALTAAQAAPSGRETLAPHASAVPVSSQHGEVPTAPGMMDIEMDEEPPRSSFTPHMLQRQGTPIRAVYPLSAPPSPWASAFRPQGAGPPPQCLPPSLLSFNPSTSSGHIQQPAPVLSPIPLTSEQLQAKAMRKAERKAERAAAREEASASDAEGEKRFPCPIEGCGKVYKQANGLKYHLTRSINSGHGNVAAIGGLAQYFSDKSGDS